MTLNQIFKIIEGFANSHSNINTVIFGANSEIDNSDVDGILMWYDVSQGNTDGTQLNYSFELAFLDVLNPDLSNLKDIMSDTLQVAQDISAAIYNYDGEIEFDLPKKSSIQPVEHKYLSDYAGHTLSFTINTPYEWNECWVPERTTPTPTPQPLFTVYDNNLVFVGTVAGNDLQVIAKDTNLNILNATYTLVGNVLTLSNIPTGLVDYILTQDGGFLLQQDSSKLVIN
tara:strand:+ start:10015 stop:10698 length:684 start_codon:yes stop_codon:yes gene_type:complete